MQCLPKKISFPPKVERKNPPRSRLFPLKNISLCFFVYSVPKWFIKNYNSIMFSPKLVITPHPLYGKHGSRDTAVPSPY